MATGFFGDLTRIPHEGNTSTNPLAFKHYHPDEVVLGKRMEDHLRFAVCYWHNFCWQVAIHLVVRHLTGLGFQIEWMIIWAQQN